MGTVVPFYKMPLLQRKNCLIKWVASLESDNLVHLKFGLIKGGLLYSQNEHKDGNKMSYLFIYYPPSTPSPPQKKGNKR